MAALLWSGGARMRSRRARWLSALTASVLLLTACGADEPQRIGFIGGLSSSMAVVGIGARDGALLAVEQANAQGGVNGRRVELLVVDDAQQAPAARTAFARLQAAGVEVAIGPTTSAMAEVIVPLAAESGMVLVSPTVTASRFDDFVDPLYRLMSSVRLYAEASARYHAQRSGVRRIAAFYDESNELFTRDWLTRFASEFEREGGNVLYSVGFRRDVGNLGNLVEQALATDPDGVLVVAGAVDAASIAREVRQRSPQMPLIGSESASSEELLQLGGDAVEGMYLSQFIDRDSDEPRFLQFVADFRQRFDRAPGFVEMAGYDAAQVALRVLRERRDGESIDGTLQRIRRFQGVQSAIEFDAEGDALRSNRITQVRDGQFVVLD